MSNDTKRSPLSDGALVLIVCAGIAFIYLFVIAIAREVNPGGFVCRCTGRGCHFLTFANDFCFSQKIGLLAVMASALFVAAGVVWRPGTPKAVQRSRLHYLAFMASGPRYNIIGAALLYVAGIASLFV